MVVQVILLTLQFDDEDSSHAENFIIAQPPPPMCIVASLSLCWGCISPTPRD